MDFASERYVRLYTRDTVTWKRLGWDGQNVLTQMLRKADRAGVVDLGGVEPWEAPVMLCGAPEDQARRGMLRALELGCIVHDGDRLVFPKYLEANETRQSDAQRQRDSREKRAAVTKRDAESQNVTGCHQPSPAVTDCHSVPSRAVPSDPCLTDPEERERARDHWSNDQREIPPVERIRIEFQKRFENATKSIPNQAQLSRAAATLLPVLTQTATLRGVSFEDALESLLGGFFASQRAKDSGYPPAFLAANPAEYLDASKNGKGREENTWRSRVEASTKKLEQLKAQRQALERSDPNYLSILYDIDRGITEETDRLERRRRELHALTG